MQRNGARDEGCTRSCDPGLIEGRHFARIAIAALAGITLAGCEQNTYVAPPPPKVNVASAAAPVTRYLEATGNTAAVKSVDLVARVQGFLQSINYKDGAFVKKGTPLFTIEPEPYKVKLDQAQAAEAGAQATLKQAEADFERQTELVARQAVSQATLDTSTSTRDNAQANLQQAQANTKIAEVNYDYTQVSRAVRRRRDGASGLGRRVRRRHLAADPARDHRRARSDLREFQRQRAGCAADARRSAAPRPDRDDLRQVPVEVGLQTETGYPHEGTLDYAAPTVNQSTGTLAVRGVSPIPTERCCPAISCACACPSSRSRMPCWCPTPRSAATRADAIVLVVNKDNVVEQRKVADRPARGRLRVIEDGLETRRPRGDRGHAARHTGPEGRSAAADDRPPARRQGERKADPKASK